MDVLVNTNYTVLVNPLALLSGQPPSCLQYFPSTVLFPRESNIYHHSLGSYNWSFLQLGQKYQTAGIPQGISAVKGGGETTTKKHLRCSQETVRQGTTNRLGGYITDSIKWIILYAMD